MQFLRKHILLFARFRKAYWPFIHGLHYDFGYATVDRLLG
jgi:hypothetical protein